MKISLSDLDSSSFSSDSSFWNLFRSKFCSPGSSVSNLKFFEFSCYKILSSVSSDLFFWHLFIKIPIHYKFPVQLKFPKISLYEVSSSFSSDSSSQTLLLSKFCSIISICRRAMKIGLKDITIMPFPRSRLHPRLSAELGWRGKHLISRNSTLLIRRTEKICSSKIQIFHHFHSPIL